MGLESVERRSLVQYEANHGRTCCVPIPAPRTVWFLSDSLQHSRWCVLAVQVHSLCTRKCSNSGGGASGTLSQRASLVDMG